MADLRRQKDAPIQIAYVIPIHMPPAVDAQAQASIRGDRRLPHVFQKMRARRRVRAKSLIDNSAHEGNERNVLGTSESFLRQQKRFLADKVAMRPQRKVESVNPERTSSLLRLGKGIPVLRQDWDFGRKSAQSFLHDRSLALRGRLARIHGFLVERLFNLSLRRRTCSRRLAPSFGLPLLNPHCAIDHPIEPDRASGISGLAGAEVGCSTQRLHLPQRRA